MTKERCIEIYKILNSRGFKSQEEIDEYQKIKLRYKELGGKDLPKINEKVKR